MQFYAPTKLGLKRSKTPEGFLVLHDVPIARTGTQIYRADEVPDGIETGPDGTVLVERDADQVFRAETIASVNGKAFTDEHPSEDVTPANWTALSKGMLQNAHRGEGNEDDLLLCDIVVFDHDMIAELDSDDGRREVSCGYDAIYKILGPGRASQMDILVNHNALVDAGRCGARCSIGDHHHHTKDCRSKPACSCQTKETSMATPKGTGAKVKDFLQRAFKAKDEKEVEKLADEMAEEMTDETGGVHLHMGEKEEGVTKDDFDAFTKKNDDEHKTFRDDIEALKAAMAAPAKSEEAATVTADEAELTKIAGELGQEAPAGTSDAMRKGAKDSALLADSFQSTVALAEVIAPGLRVPAFDRKMAPKAGLSVIDTLRGTALDIAYHAPVTRGMIDEVLQGQPFDLRIMSFSDKRTLFNSIGAMRKRANNADLQSFPESSAGGGAPVAPLSLADINKQNRERYARSAH